MPASQLFTRTIRDWDDAYANMPNIPGGAEYPPRWAREAETFRLARSAAGLPVQELSYGADERQRIDLLLPDGQPKGLVVFVHGGYWMRFDRSLWTHLAAGSLAHGYAVAMPSYRLCPDVRIAEIVGDVRAAVETAATAVPNGPLLLAGHSAGGHLVTRLAARDGGLSEETIGRLAHVLSISGVHDLRPLMRIALNETLRVDAAEAAAESPALLEPIDGLRLTCWVGAAERGEFVRQNALLANVWTGLGAGTTVVEEPDRHHFDVVDGLCDPMHAMTRTLLGA